MYKLIRYFGFVCFLLFLSTLVGCSKEKKEIVESKWEVESIKQNDNSALKTSTQSYILTFEKKKEYYLNLDINSCAGKVNFIGKNTIDFKSAFCTYICCDSSFAEELIEVIALVNKYDINDTKLILKGKNGERIILNKV
jgi:META domain-containing protein